MLPHVIALSCGRDSDTDPRHLKQGESLSPKDTTRTYVVVLGLVDSRCRSSCLCTALIQILVGTAGPFQNC